MTEKTKILITANLGLIRGEHIYGIGAKLFLQNIAQKTDADFMATVLGLQSQISDNERAMAEILGDGFDFFKNLNVDNINHGNISY
jgi:hypothetical protein